MTYFWPCDLVIWPLTLKDNKHVHWATVHLWVQNSGDMSKVSWVKMCQFHLNIDIKGWFCRHPVTSFLTSPKWKHFFLDYLNKIFSYLMSNGGYLSKFLKSLNFQKWRNFQVLANFFVGSVNGNQICYLDSQGHYLHFELFNRHSSWSLNEVTAISNFDPIFDLVTQLFHIWPT